MEIERQFLVAAIPVLPRKYDSILQGYVSVLPEIRIRQVRTPDDTETFFLTVKRGTGLSREEWETQISSTEFAHLVERLEPDTDFIEKRRYFIPLEDGHVAEFHRHEAALKGFNYVEVEFASEEEAHAFMPPDWFGREVTEDPRFTYGRLVRADGPELAKEILAEPPAKRPEELIPEEFIAADEVPAADMEASAIPEPAETSAENDGPDGAKEPDGPAR